MFESRSTPRGGIFWAPSPLLPLPPMGSGLPQGSMLPPGTRGPPGVLASSPTSRLLPSFHPFFPGTGGQGPGLPALLPCFQEAGLPLCFQGARLPVVRGPCGHAFRRLSGGPASMLSGGFPVAGFQTSNLPPCFQAFRRPGPRARASHT